MGGCMGMGVGLLKGYVRYNILMMIYMMAGLICLFRMYRLILPSHFILYTETHSLHTHTPLFLFLWLLLYSAFLFLPSLLSLNHARTHAHSHSHYFLCFFSSLYFLYFSYSIYYLFSLYSLIFALMYQYDGLSGYTLFYYYLIGFFFFITLIFYLLFSILSVKCSQFLSGSCHL